MIFFAIFMKSRRHRCSRTGEPFQQAGSARKRGPQEQALLPILSDQESQWERRPQAQAIETVQEDGPKPFSSSPSKADKQIPWAILRIQ